MPRLKKSSKLQERERKKVQKRESRRKEKVNSELLIGSEGKGLIFPKKSENGLIFPKKSENGLIFPKKSECAENGLNFPKKSECAENNLLVPAKCFTDAANETFAKCFPHECLSACTDFDETFANTYPDAVANRHDRTSKVSSENEEVVVWNTDNEIMETDPEIALVSNDSSCSDSLFEIMDSDNPEATQSASLLWNAKQITFGSFHQNDKRFIDQSRGFQCTCNALCMLVCDDIQNSLVLDKILYDGDALYNKTVNNLKAQGKFVHSLLSLEEIPDALEIETEQFFVEKQSITCGTLVNTSEDNALPTLHCTLEAAFIKATSVLLIIGAVCSAVRKRNNSYIFFDSHSHGENGLSSSDGTSILMIFSCLEDLIAYLYAFYESMRIDMTTQFDLLPISIRKNEHADSHKKQPENLLEAYFNDQTMRQQQKGGITNNSDPILKVKTKKSRKQYYRIYMQNVRQNSAFKAKELVAQRKSKQNARQDRDYKAKELVANRKHMHKARQDRDYKAKELVAQRKHMHKARQDRDYKAKELVANRKHMHKARQDRDYKAKELVANRKHMHKSRQDRDYKAKELVAQRKSKQNGRQDRDYKAKELVANRKQMHKARQDRDYKAKELVAQCKSKQNARRDRDYKAKELVTNQKHMRKARQDRDYKAKELVAQRKSKQNARKNLFVLECERVKKQEYRKKKRKMDEVNEFIDLEETRKKRKNKFDDHRLEKTADQSYQSYFKDIKEVSNNFIQV